jgi:hypothetical protein
MVVGLLDAKGRYVAAVVRVNKTRPGKVVVVIGRAELLLSPARHFAVDWK